MSQKNEAAMALMQAYIEGTRTGDAKLIRSLFHPDARMSGYLKGQLLVGGPEPFFDVVANAPSPAKSGDPYEAKVRQLEVSGPVASAVIEESSYLGLKFTNYFHMVEVDGRWQIVSKTFMHR